MSISNITQPNNIDLFCRDFDCKDMKCTNMTIPSGGDLNAHDIKVNNDLLVKTQDGLGYIKYNTANQGNAGEQLTIDALGNAYWANSAGPGGVSNPLSTDLNTNGFLIQNNIGTNSNINITPTNILTTGDVIINDNLIMSGEIKGTNSTTGLILDSTGTNNNITMKGGKTLIDNVDGIDMNTNDITNCNIIRSDNNDLILSGNNGGFPANILLSGNRVDISAPNGIDMKTHDITNCNSIATKNINNIKIIRTESDFNGSTNLSGIYHIYDKVTLTSSYTLTGDTVLYGIGGRDQSSLDFNLGGPELYCISNTDYNLEIINLNFSNISAGAALLFCSNTNKDKILTFTNSSFRDCENDLIDIRGFDLVDLNQVLFQYNVVSKHFYHDSGSKLQISSCEFLRQGRRANPIVTWGTAPMIKLEQTTSNWGAINISSNLIHPQQTQDGIDLGIITPLEAVISSNTFISVGLTTGTLLKYQAGSINNYPSLVVSDNSGIRNEKALLEGNVLQNTNYTATTAGNYEPVDFGPGFITPILFRFAPTANPFEFQYTGKAPISCLINVGLTADQNTGGNDTILFGINQNGTIVSELEISLNSGTPKSFSFNTVLLLAQNDLLQFQVLNQTAGTNAQGFRAVSFQGSLVEV